MKHDDLKRLFPHASAAVLAANGEVSNTEPQRDKTPALGGTISGKATGIQRTRIRFIGYRVRLLDPDNFAGSVKDLLDGLRHAEIVQDDTIECVILETEQKRVSTRAEEKTVIELSME